MALAALAFGAAFAGAPALGRTATLAYWAAGLAYLWTHFFVHLPIAPRSRYAQAVRRHHMLCAHPSRGFGGLIGLGGDWAGPQRAAFCRAHGAGCASVPPGALCALRGLACLWPAPILCVVPHAPLSTRLARQGQSRALGAGAARVSCMLPLKKEGARARCGCARREAAPGAAQAPLPLGGALAVLLRAGGGRRVWHAAGVGGGGAHHAARRAAEGPHAQGGWAGILSAALNAAPLHWQQHSVVGRQRSARRDTGVGRACSGACRAAEGCPGLHLFTVVRGRHRSMGLPWPATVLVSALPVSGSTQAGFL